MIQNSISFLLIIAIALDRYYSVTQPHKAASLVTISRAKKVLSVIVLFSLCHVLQFRYSGMVGRLCIPTLNGNQDIAGQIYRWFVFVVYGFLLFVVVLYMNIVIVCTIKRHSVFKKKMQLSENRQAVERDRQTFVILFLITVSVFVCVGPAYPFYFYFTYYDFTVSGKRLAAYELTSVIFAKLYVINYCINFFLYVLSGTKFRSEVASLFRCGSLASTSTSKNF